MKKLKSEVPATDFPLSSSECQVKGPFKCTSQLNKPRQKMRVI